MSEFKVSAVYDGEIYPDPEKGYALKEIHLDEIGRLDKVILGSCDQDFNWIFKEVQADEVTLKVKP